MRMKLARWWMLACLLTSSSAHADDGDTPSSYQTWVSTTLQGNVYKRFALMLDMHGRFYDDFQPYQLLFRPAAGLQIGKGMYLFLGYGWTPSWNTQHQYTSEHRIWEQWQWDIPGLTYGLRLFLRSRLEQRFRDVGEVSTGVRFRQLLRLLIPVERGSPLHLSVWDEAFVSFNDAGGGGSGPLWQHAGFDQNRLFAGVGVFVGAVTRLELGYLNHHIVRPGADTVHHVCSINAAINFK